MTVSIGWHLFFAQRTRTAQPTRTACDTLRRF
jgi:hypothetical protein